MLEDKNKDLNEENENVEEVSIEDLGIFGGGCDCSSCHHGCGPKMDEEEIEE